MARFLFFGRLREALGAGELAAALPDGVSDTESVRAWLGGDHPVLLDPSVRIAVNAEIGHGNAPIADGDEIAFMPPMSGG
jgi:molybdopterin synthase sulfur carrier subunit